MIRTMTGFCANPNVGAVLLVGLGCELLTPELIGAELRKSGQRFETISIQSEGGTAAAVKTGVRIAEELLSEVAGVKRRPFDIAELTVGVKCGGSDTLSGLTANPALGLASDTLVSHNATVLMSEVPEMLGAEQVLVRRAVDAAVGERLREIVATMETSILQMGVDVRGTEPSPGNIAGGLSTLEEKSLGAILKGGRTAVRQVVNYAQKPDRKGLVIMDGPALDAVCITGMLAAGAQLIVFTTGRGSPLGAAIAPVIKVATNTDMYLRMRDDMDINAGAILDGTESLETMGQTIFQEILRTASGKSTSSETLGHLEFAIHSVGPAV
jgi:altronate dehydratase large subunit